MERGRGGKGEREGWGRPPALLPPTGFCLKYHPAPAPFLPPWAPKRLAPPSRPRLQSADVATSRKGLKGANCYVLFFSTQRTPLVFVGKVTCRRIVHCGKDCMHKLSSFWWSHHITAVDRQIARQLTARFLLAVIP